MSWRWLWGFGRGGPLGFGRRGCGVRAASPSPRPELSFLSPCSGRSPGGALAGLFRPRLPEDGSPPTEKSSQNGKHQQHKTWGDRNVYCYTQLEAFTWSTLAILTLELTKQVNWLHSVQPDGRNTKVCQSEPQSADLSQCHHSGNFAFPSGTSFESDSSLLDLKTNVEEEELVKAACQVRETFQASISVASNILGLENMEAEQYKMAFSCFKLAADHNYSKAQYNLGLCYEHGRGTTKDMTKAILYYQRAAHQGHLLAQYRYTKWLFCCWYKAAMQNQHGLPLKGRTCLSSPCLQSLGQPRSAHLGQPAVGLLRSWSIGHLGDTADNCELQPCLGLSEEASIKLPPFPCCSEIVVD